ncbi:gamma-glutamyltransferase [Cumulibacter manganitolerans]|uniref:gamma-glutamyltransferase n=1 Tax=Cumulibacter manganitolerans TaxID=1884992 RepID=UPI001E3D376C|nr:gamma-glutamyltransferase [Cumulibacter manganitolerans]
MTHGMISAPQPEAVEAGLDVLAAGGNAVDAAVATALTQTAVDPQMCGIAGFGTFHVYQPQAGVHTTLDFHGRSPLAVRPDMWEHLIEREAEDGWGFILKGRVNEKGYGAISTPRTLAALEVALQRFGTRQLTELLDPAIAYCENGFAVRPHMWEFWNEPAGAGRDPNIGLVTKNPAARAIYGKGDGATLDVGDVLRNPDMAATLRRIREHGTDDFYRGAIAERIVEDMRANGGLLGPDDLATCAPEDNAPLWGTYRGHRIATNNPPGGGIQLIEMLNILENFDLASLGHNSPEYIRILAEAMKIATADKDAKVGDPRFVEVPVEELTSKEYAAGKAQQIRDGVKAEVPRFNSGGGEHKHTTQVAAVDEHGTCVTMTHTLGQPSGVITPGLGFMYNGAMSVFDPRPGRAGSLAPGKARFSALSPTIVFRDDRPVLVLGAPGATYITVGNLQVILNVIDFGMSAQEAIDAPRVAALSETIELTNRVLRSTERDLQALGYPTRRYPQAFKFAWVHAIRIGDDGRWDGGADRATDGMAASV